MTRAQLDRLTVPELREKCRAAGLPAWQHRGRRLRKADLVGLLTEKAGVGRHRRPRRCSSAAVGVDTAGLVDHLAEALISSTIAYELPPDPAAAAAQRRIFRGSRARRDLRILDGRRRQALAMLADQAADPLRRLFRAMLAAFPPTD